MKIDAVITWVDGNDPKHKKKRESYLTSAREDKHDDIGGESRFVQSDEIKFCIASIIRFAPFINRIFIVTDSQIPDIDEFLEENFGEDYPEVDFVDHHDIFGPQVNLLPVFNSFSIETMLSRIPGLSQKFVYFNDDMFLLNPVEKTDWFTPMGIPVAYGRRWPVWVLKLSRTFRKKKRGRRVLGFRDAILNAAFVARKSRIPVIGHTPHAMLKSGCEAMFKKYSAFMIGNVAHRFRHPSQFNVQALYYGTQPVEFRSVEKAAVFLKPRKGSVGYVARKLKEIDRKGDSLKFGCVNGAEKMSFQEKKLFDLWMSRRLRIKL